MSAPQRVSVPLDLLLTLLWTLLGTLFLLQGMSGPLRLVLGLPLFLFLPGYALLAFLFPRRGPPPAAPPDDPRRKRGEIDAWERAVFTLVLSLVLAAAWGVVLSLSPWGLTLPTLLGGLTLTTVGFLLLGFVRRSRVPPEERWGWEWNSKPTRAVGGALLGLLVLGVVAGASVVGLFSPPLEGRSTEFYLLGRGGEARDYPTRLPVGEEGTVIVGVVNGEGRPMEFEVEVLRTSVSGIENRTHVATYSLKLEKGEKDERSLHFSLPSRGLWRVDFELRRLGLDPAGKEPYRNLRLWVWGE